MVVRMLRRRTWMTWMTWMTERCWTYISPLLDLDFGDVLDGDLEPVPVSHPRVHDTKATLAKDRAHLSSEIGQLKSILCTLWLTHLVELLKLFSWGAKHIDLQSTSSHLCQQNMIITIVTLLAIIHYHHHCQHNFIRAYSKVFQKRRSDNMKYDFWSFGTLESFIDQQSTIYVLLYSCFPLIGVFLPCCSATQHWRTMRYKTCYRAKVLRAFSRPQWILTETALHSWTQEEEEVEIAEWMF